MKNEDKNSIGGFVPPDLEWNTRQTKRTLIDVAIVAIALGLLWWLFESTLGWGLLWLLVNWWLIILAIGVGLVLRYGLRELLKVQMTPEDKAVAKTRKTSLWSIWF